MAVLYVPLIIILLRSWLSTSHYISINSILISNYISEDHPSQTVRDTKYATAYNKTLREILPSFAFHTWNGWELQNWSHLSLGALNSSLFCITKSSTISAVLNLTHIPTFNIHHILPVIQPRPSFNNPQTSIQIFSLNLSFFFRYLDCWNAFPDNVRQSSTLTSFQRQINLFELSKYLNGSATDFNK